MTWKAWVEFAPEYGEYRMVVLDRVPDGVTVLRQIGPERETQLEFHKIPNGGLIPNEFRVYIERDILQAIVDGCAMAGIVANSFSGDELKATKSHLEDMRAIAFHKVGANKP